MVRVGSVMGRRVNGEGGRSEADTALSTCSAGLQEEYLPVATGAAGDQTGLLRAGTGEQWQG